VEGSLSLIVGFDTNIIKSPLDIKLGKVLGSAELQNKLGDQEEEVFALNSVMLSMNFLQKCNIEYILYH